MRMACCLQEYGLWDSELAYSAALIHRDHRNNSAWTQRAWIIDHAPNFCGAPSAEILLHRELLYAAELIKNFKEQNESLWTYIRGLFGLRHWAGQRLLLSRTPAVFELCIEVLKGCPHAVWPRDLLSECYLGLMQLALERLAARLNPLGAAYAAAAPATPVAVPPVDGGQNAASAAAAAVAGSSRNRAAAGGAEASEQDMEIEDSAASEALQLLAGSPPPKAAPAYQSNLLPFTPAGPGQALAGSHPPQSTAFPDTPFTPIALPEECDDDKDAFEDAYTILEALLQDLMEVDPARCMYYHHRVSEMEALRACMQL